MPGTQVTDILLLDLPVALWERSVAATEALVAGLADAGPEGPAGRLTALVARLETYFEVSAPSELELRAAAAKRLKEVDVAYTVPRAARDDLGALCGAIDAAEAYCRAHGLESLCAPPDVAAFRHWFLGQIVTQLDGGFPTAWTAAEPRH